MSGLVGYGLVILDPVRCGSTRCALVWFGPKGRYGVVHWVVVCWDAPSFGLPSLGRVW